MRGSAFYDRKYLATTNAVYAYLLALCFFCWIAGYVKSLGYPLYGEVTASPLWNWICQTLPDVTTTYLVGIVLMFGGAFFVHRANYVMVLIREKTLLPFLYYAFFTIPISFLSAPRRSLSSALSWRSISCLVPITTRTPPRGCSTRP